MTQGRVAILTMVLLGCGIAGISVWFHHDLSRRAIAWWPAEARELIQGAPASPHCDSPRPGPGRGCRGCRRNRRTSLRRGQPHRRTGSGRGDAPLASRVVGRCKFRLAIGRASKTARMAIRFGASRRSAAADGRIRLCRRPGRQFESRGGAEDRSGRSRVARILPRAISRGEGERQ